MKTLSKGNWGERLAEQHLQNKGYRIIARNFKKRYGEIDLIALHNQTLIFVEVKTRWNQSHGTPEEAITPWKIKTLVKTAHYFKLLHPELPDGMRMDAVAVEINEDNSISRIEHIQNITGY